VPCAPRATLLQKPDVDPIYPELDGSSGAEKELRKSMSPGSINEQLDQKASLGLLRATMTLEDVADEVKSSFGHRPAVATLSRLENGKRVRPVFGLRETEIRWTFHSASGIARDAQLAELDLRIVKWKGEGLEAALVRAERMVGELAGRMKSLRPARDTLERAEGRLDGAALDSLRQQIRLYREGLLDKEKTGDRARLMREALQFAGRVRLVADELFADAEPSGQIVCSRVGVNGFFSNYVLDVIDGETERLPRSREFARRWGTTQMLTAAFRCAGVTHDPRLAHHFAELAVLLPPASKAPAGTLDLNAERPSVDPVVTAARLLVMSKRLDRQERTPMKAWKPRWLEARIPQLEEALLMAEQAERGPIQPGA
jgi:hypothetical protein